MYFFFTFVAESVVCIQNITINYCQFNSTIWEITEMVLFLQMSYFVRNPTRTTA